jgi:hexosaminidase
MAFPRMLALSEVAWSSTANKNFADFTRRLPANFRLLDKQNVNYRIPEPTGLKNMVVGGDGRATVELMPALGTKIYYTLDGSAPDEKSKSYDKPITVELKPNEKVELKTVVANSVGRKSVVYAATLIRHDMFPAVEPGERKPGVRFEISSNNPNDGIFTGEAKSIQPAQLFTQLRGVKDFVIDPKSPFNVEFTGLINIPADGIYEFQVDSTWGASIDLGDGNIIDEKGTKDRTVKSAVIPLKAGFHDIGFRYTHGGGEMFFRVRYGIKGQGLRQIGGGELVH